MSAFSYPLVILLLSLTIFVPEAFAGLREVVVSHTDERCPPTVSYEGGRLGQHAIDFLSMDAACQAFLPMARSWLMWNK